MPETRALLDGDVSGCAFGAIRRLVRSRGSATGIGLRSFDRLPFGDEAALADSGHMVGFVILDVLEVRTRPAPRSPCPAGSRVQASTHSPNSRLISRRHPTGTPSHLPIVCFAPSDSDRPTHRRPPGQRRTGRPHHEWNWPGRSSLVRMFANSTTRPSTTIDGGRAASATSNAALKMRSVFGAATSGEVFAMVCPRLRPSETAPAATAFSYASLTGASLSALTGTGRAVRAPAVRTLLPPGPCCDRP